MHNFDGGVFYGCRSGIQRCETRCVSNCCIVSTTDIAVVVEESAPTIFSPELLVFSFFCTFAPSKM
jgi:hypothetical protein